ncbi:type-F conjugative transfer system secretin TraK [Pectobacterium brasiliense]|uniref:type-F conjugative transfer system secretin TraK n=1 Tax=Pectobacterium brasiliense TaxID=180957 RepID=UPI0019698772|nr:type-F conjugative transfer system secretin TraK [Pectobacterium brasiliense]MBN3262963.1 type-F conjugative transfer system secretin TraK [Pectobacterium brasiliense]
MRIRFSQAAAAVLFALGLPGGLMAATNPLAFTFENDATFTVPLSNTNPNKIVIDGEMVTRISGPDGAYDMRNTEDGALILSPLVGQDFTVFLETANGAAVSLNVQPKPGTGRTVRLTPLSPPSRSNGDAKAWEESDSYAKTLVSLSQSVVRGDVPEGFNEYPVSRMAGYSPNVSVQIVPERQLVGSHLRVVRFRLKNTSHVTQELKERDFWKKGVRGVMLSTPRLYPEGLGYAWIIFSSVEGSN